MVFKEKAPTQRNQIICESHLCFNCLAPGHTALDCRAKGSVGRVDVHTTCYSPPTSSQATPSLTASGLPHTNLFCPDKHTSKAISITALVDFRTKNACQRGRLFLDPGYEVSLITKKKAKNLQAKLIPHKMGITVISENTILSTHKTRIQLEWKADSQLLSCATSSINSLQSTNDST